MQFRASEMTVSQTRRLEQKEKKIQEQKFSLKINVAEDWKNFIHKLV